MYCIIYVKTKFQNKCRPRVKETFSCRTVDFAVTSECLKFIIEPFRFIVRANTVSHSKTATLYDVCVRHDVCRVRALYTHDRRPRKSAERRGPTTAIRDGTRAFEQYEKGVSGTGF